MYRFQVNVNGKNYDYIDYYDLSRGIADIELLCSDKIDDIDVFRNHLRSLNADGTVRVGYENSGKTFYVSIEKLPACN